MYENKVQSTIQYRLMSTIQSTENFTVKSMVILGMGLDKGSCKGMEVAWETRLPHLVLHYLNKSP